MDAERPREKVPIPGTDGWLRVTTTHGNVFYAQKKTKRSEWTVPDEIRAQVEAMDGRPTKRARTASPPPAPAPAAPVPEHAEDDADDDSEAELAPAPAPEPAAAAPPAAAPIPMAPDLSFEEGRALFLTMLSSLNGTAHEINPMAPWDRELPKFVHLPAYSALRSTRDREDVFNEWCKLRLREKRERSRAQPSAERGGTPSTPGAGASSDAARALRSLFKKHVVSTRTTFAEAQQKYGADPRFTAVPESEARAVFDAWLAELAEIKRTLARKADDAFVALLAEKLPPPASVRAEHGVAQLPDKAQAATIWASAKKTPGLVEDKRYDAVGSATRRAELFAQWVRGAGAGSDAAAATSARAAGEGAPGAGHTSSSTGGPTSGSTGGHTSSADPPRADPPGDARGAPSGAPARSAERRERALQQREAQVRRDQSRMHDRNRAARTDVVAEQREQEFRQLLLDTVRDACLAWDDAVPVLRRDTRYAPPGGARDVLSDAAKRTFFDEHIAHLQAKRREQLARLFAKHATDARGREQLAVDMDTVLAHVRHDDAFAHAGLQRFVGEDGGGAHRAFHTTLEREFAAWDAERQARARAEFGEMLRENAFVDFWGRLRQQKAEHAARSDVAVGEDDDIDPEGVSVYDLASQVDLTEMEAVLRPDVRYARLAHVPEERTALLAAHLRTLPAPRATIHQART